MKNALDNYVENKCADILHIEIRSEDGEQVVNARELYNFLGVGKDFSNWIKYYIDYGYKKGQDYFTKTIFAKFGEKSNKRGRPMLEYWLTTGMAANIAMMQRSDKGRQVRDFFYENAKQSAVSQNLDEIDRIAQFGRVLIETANYMRRMKEDVDKRFNAITKQVDNIEERMKVEHPDEGAMELYKAAEHLGIYSENGNPHAALLGAFAREAGIKTPRNHSHNDNFSQVLLNYIDGKRLFVVYLKPDGIQKVDRFIDEHGSDYYREDFYKKCVKSHGQYHFPGDIKDRYYFIRGRKYHFMRSEDQLEVS